MFERKPRGGAKQWDGQRRCAGDAALVRWRGGQFDVDVRQSQGGLDKTRAASGRKEAVRESG